ncbi:MAG: hypothetical protein WDN44_13685 [Sphingomonas sp.]
MLPLVLMLADSDPATATVHAVAETAAVASERDAARRSRDLARSPVIPSAA